MAAESKSAAPKARTRRGKGKKGDGAPGHMTDVFEHHLFMGSKRHALFDP